MKIAAIIVTYNRKQCLCKCIEAVEQQSYPLSMIYIVDNASTDGTGTYVEEIKRNISNIKSIRLDTNTGGAGGFYYGMKKAYEESESDALWVMDDDGIPDKYCLENLVSHLNDYAFLSPLVLNIDNPREMAFNTLKEVDVESLKKKYAKGFIENHSNPFNGVIFRRDLIKKIGYPKKEMFIWGDENEYEARIKYYGMKYATVIDAIHYHPKDRLTLFRDFLGRETIVYVDSKLRRYCKYRNMAYILNIYKGKVNVIFYVIRYVVYYIFTRKFDFSGLFLFFTAVIDGLKGDFSKHIKYL